MEKRKDKLGMWTNRIARHPVLSQSYVIQHFLTCTDGDEKVHAYVSVSLSLPLPLPLPLSLSEMFCGWYRAIVCCQEWKAGKRKAEKDDMVAGSWYLTVQPEASVEIQHV